MPEKENDLLSNPGDDDDDEIWMVKHFYVFFLFSFFHFVEKKSIKWKEDH